METCGQEHQQKPEAVSGALIKNYFICMKPAPSCENEMVHHSLSVLHTEDLLSRKQ